MKFICPHVDECDRAKGKRSVRCHHAIGHEILPNCDLPCINDTKPCIIMVESLPEELFEI